MKKIKQTPKRIQPFSHEKGFCWVSEKYHLIFIPIPKNASTSIRNITLFEFHLDNYFRYQTRVENGEYKVFTIIREPLDRFVSAYIEVCERAYSRSLSSHSLLQDFYWEKDPKKRFYKFLKSSEQLFFDQHILPQSYFITDYNDNLINIDYMIDFTQIEKEFDEMLMQLDIYPIYLPWKNIRIVKKNRSAINSIHSLLSKNLNYRIKLYLFMDKVVRYFQRRPLPKKESVFQFVEEDKILKNRIMSLYEDDVKIYKDVIE